MVRRLIVLVLMAFVFMEGAALAQTAAPSAKRRSTTSRVVWTIVGAGAGFGAGLYLGLNKFDDAINSDRKVWTSAIVGAVAGGIAGGLLSADRRREPPAINGRDAFGSAIPSYHRRTLREVASFERVWMPPAVHETSGR